MIWKSHVYAFLSLLPCISFRFISNLSIVITIFRKRSLFSMLMFMNWERELQCKIMWLFVQHNSQQMLLILLVYCIEIYISIYSHRRWKFLLVCRFFFSKEFKHFLVQLTLQSWRVSSLYCRKCNVDIHYCLWMYIAIKICYDCITQFSIASVAAFKGHQR